MNKKGFTLVEILAVVVLLSLLVVFATSSGFGAFNKTKGKIDATQAKSIEEGFKVFLIELKEENCVDSVGSYTNPLFEDIKVIFGDTSADVDSCKKARNYIASKLATSGGTIEVDVNKFISSGYVVGTSIEDIGDTAEITLSITGTAVASTDINGNTITDVNGNTIYEIDGDLSHNFIYEEYSDGNDKNTQVVYIDSNSGNDNNNGKKRTEPLKTIEEAIDKYKEKNKKLVIKLLDDYTLASDIDYSKDIEITSDGERKKVTLTSADISTEGSLSFSNIELMNPSSSVIKKAQESSKNTIVINNFEFTGSEQELDLVSGEYILEVWGAQGGNYGTYQGGKGGYSKGTLTIEEDTKVYIYVGGQPASNTNTRVVVQGGYNGGGNGCNRNWVGTYTYAQGGGGGTDIRVDTNNDSVGTLFERVIVAGGGSGCNNRADGYAAGGEIGETGYSGYAGTQIAAGKYGEFGKGASASTYGTNYKYGSAGGGGGWYGGGAYSGYSDSYIYDAYTGGGSGYVYTSESASNYRSGCLLNSSYYLTNTELKGGTDSFKSPDGTDEIGHTGNGYARITLTIN